MLPKVFLIFLFIAGCLSAQLKEFEITVSKASSSTPVFVNYPDDAAVIIYSSVENINFESNTGGIVSVKSDIGKYTIILKTERQFLTMKLRGFREEKISIPKLEAREVRYFAVEEKKQAGSTIIPISIITNPAGANIYIDGTFGGTAVTHQVSEGVHTIRLEKTGYSPLEQSIEVKPDKVLFEFTLQKEKLHTVTILSEPKGANIYIDNIEKGKTDNQMFLFGGEYNLRLTLGGYLNINETLKVGENENPEKKYSFIKNSGILEITVSPSDAEILIDNRSADTQGGKIELLPGDHILRVQKTGYLPIEEKFKLEIGQTIQRNFSLVKNSGFAEIAITPPDAEILIDNRSAEVHSGRVELIPGEHLLRIQKTGYFPVEEKIVIELGKTVKKTFTLQKNTGTLVIKTEPAEAEIYINRVKQPAGGSYFELAPGKYSVEIKKEGYYGKDEIAEIELGKTINKTYSLIQITGSLQFSINPFTAEVTLSRAGTVIEKWKGLKIFDNLPVGDYQIEAKAEGHKTSKNSVAITENKTESLKIEMEPGSDDLFGPENMILVKGGPRGDFLIGKTEVTFEQYEKYCEESGAKRPNDEGWGRGKRPVINVSIKDALDFCRWLSKKLGKNVRLPEEDEWEYAAKEGSIRSTFTYSGSNNLNEVGWYDRNSSSKTQPAASKKPNALGIYDLSGNVWEWCGTTGAMRGGSWYDSINLCAISLRNYSNSSNRLNYVGFRVLQEL